MDMRIEGFFESVRGKTVAFCGIGVSNLPLVFQFLNKGAKVIACDRKAREELGSVADEMEAAGATLRCGEGYLDELDADILFRTPGMYFHSKEIESFRKSGRIVTSEMEVFFDLCPAHLIAVTGSDGKTTTTTLISEMLKAEGKTVYTGGNIGKALLPDVEKMNPSDYAVVELSSFQLISMRKSPDIAVVTNVAPNHLDVHGTMEEYIDTKINLIRHQNAFSKTILNLDNEITRSFAHTVRGRLSWFSMKEKTERGAWCDEKDDLYLNGERIMNASDIKLPGRHNIENYLAAISATEPLVSKETVVKVAKNFGGVEHRIEFVRELSGVRYYNDSIATSPTRTIAGLCSFGVPLIMIAGGYDKHIPYAPLAPYVNEFVKLLILTGDTAPVIESAVKSDPSYDESKIMILHADGLEDAVEKAQASAQPGDIVTLSPASASFDKYPNFEARGKHFKELVANLK